MHGIVRSSVVLNAPVELIADGQMEKPKGLHPDGGAPSPPEQRGTWGG